MNSISKPVSFSRTTITELMIPSYANFGGKIHGGILLSLMDKVAYACASKHAENYCVTVSVDGVEFLQPVEVGELVSLKASVNYVGRTSLVVGIHVSAENVKKGIVKHTNNSYFTMVSKGEDNRPATVPVLALESMDDVRRFIETIKRREIKKESNQKFQHEAKDFIVDEDIELLENERCKLKLR